MTIRKLIFIGAGAIALVATAFGVRWFTTNGAVAQAPGQGQRLGVSGVLANLACEEPAQS